MASGREKDSMTEMTIAHLRQQIISEHEAAQQGLFGLASIASHRSITARMERAVQHLQTLYDAGREQEAQALLFSDALYEVGEEASCGPC
jgi:hypothetical protein